MKDPAFEACTTQLKELLIHGTRRCLASAEYPALLFSGGLDSCILAATLSTLGPRSGLLVVAGSSGATDVQAARQAAATLGLRLEIRQFTIVEVAEVLPSILTVIRSTDVLQVSLAIPLYFAASRAHELGVTVLLSGQGADELFGGYARYERFLQEGKVETVNVAMQADFEKLLQTTLPCQAAIATHHAIQFAAPYLDESVVAFARKLPLPYKLQRTNHGVVRKRILRNLAVDLKLPAAIAGAPKRAAQYGSGATRLLTELSTDYWRRRTPELSARNSRTQGRIQQFLDALKQETL